MIILASRTCRFYPFPYLRPGRGFHSCPLALLNKVIAFRRWDPASKRVATGRPTRPCVAAFLITTLVQEEADTLHEELCHSLESFLIGHVEHQIAALLPTPGFDSLPCAVACGSATAQRWPGMSPPMRSKSLGRFSVYRKSCQISHAYIPMTSAGLKAMISHFPHRVDEGASLLLEVPS